MKLQKQGTSAMKAGLSLSALALVALVPGRASAEEWVISAPTTPSTPAAVAPTQPPAPQPLAPQPLAPQPLAPQPAGPTPAPAAQPCPPGSWFCSETPEAKPAAPPLEPLPPPETPADDGTPARPAGEKPADEKAAPSPPVVVYQPPPPVMVVPPSGETPSAYESRRRALQAERPEWGLNLHLSGSILGSGAAKGAGMGGVGVGLRYRPIPHLALQGGVAFTGGRDYEGTQRGETSFIGSLYVFLNPQDKFQLFLVGGFGWSTARIGDDRYGNAGPGYNYDYFGGQGGAGAEWRLARHFALYGDVRAFLRSRTDSRAAVNPEFTDDYGRTTNTSGGGLFSGGMTFYF